MTNIARDGMDVKGSWKVIEPLVRAFVKAQNAYYGRNGNADIESRLLPDWGQFEGLRPAAAEVAARWGYRLSLSFEQMRRLATEIHDALTDEHEAAYANGYHDAGAEKGD